MTDYFLPAAQRAYGETPAGERNATTLARWINTSRPAEVHVRHLQRVVRLPGLRTTEQIRDAHRPLSLPDGCCKRAERALRADGATVIYRQSSAASANRLSRGALQPLSQVPDRLDLTDVSAVSWHATSRF